MAISVMSFLSEFFCCFFFFPSDPAFLPLTDELSMDLPAFFVLKFYQPIPMSSCSIEEIQRLTGMLSLVLRLSTSVTMHCFFLFISLC